MNDRISPKYQMKVAKEVYNALLLEFSSNEEIKLYIEKWHEIQFDWNGNIEFENFTLYKNDKGGLDLLPTLHNIDGETLLKIAIDLDVDTPDFIPSIPTFRNELKTSYETANATFERAFKQIEEHPDIAIGLVNSALESIVKEILKDEMIQVKPKNGDTLYDLTQNILKEFQLFPNSDMPIEIKTIGSSLLTINQNIEKIRSEKTNFHGKANGDYFIKDPLYSYFIVNSVTTVGLFLISFYRQKLPKINSPIGYQSETDDLPF